MKYRILLILCTTGLLLSGCGNSIPDADMPSDTASETQSLTEQTAQTTTVEPAMTVAQIMELPAGTELPAEWLNTELIDQLFTAQPIPDTVFVRMNNVSYHENPYITRDDLRYLRLLHCAPDGSQYIGEMVVNQSIAEDVLEIFRTLYDAQYPIERMVLVDVYGGDDEASMAANNTSAFNYRVVPNTTTLSNHARGLAIDINPCYNPYITYRSDGTAIVSPANGADFADRSTDFSMKIDENDLCLRLFTEHGFVWGGSWTTVKDYQHFEKTE